MAFFVTDSKTALLTDTLPALKTIHYNGTFARDNVYSYARFYFFNGALFGCFTSFDEKPLKSTKMSLYLQGINAKKTAVISAGKHCEAKAYTQDENEQNKIFYQAQNSNIFLGEDEQGIFWNVNFSINEKNITEMLGKKVQSGDVFNCNLFLHSEEESAFASAFKTHQNEILSANGGQIIVVPY